MKSMKRLWLKIPGLKVRDIYPRKPLNGEESFYMDVQLGEALNAKGVIITKRPDGMSQNWAMANIRFLDVPILHKKTSKKKPLLHDVLATVLAEEYWTQFDGVFRNNFTPTELEFVDPKEWKGMSLRIPVDFIKLFNFRIPRLNGPVWAHVQVGHHLIVWEKQVFNGQEDFDLDLRGRSVILDPKLRELIKGFLERPNTRAAISKISKAGVADLKMELSTGVKGYDTDLRKIPPAIRFY